MITKTFSQGSSPCKCQPAILTAGVAEFQDTAKSRFPISMSECTFDNFHYYTCMRLKEIEIRSSSLFGEGNTSCSTQLGNNNKSPVTGGYSIYCKNILLVDLIGKRCCGAGVLNLISPEFSFAATYTHPDNVAIG